jgi:hypothetical protein
MMKTEDRLLQSYKIQCNKSQLLFIDDIKVYSSMAHQLKQSLKLVEMFSKEIDMKLGFEKHESQSIRRG